MVCMICRYFMLEDGTPCKSIRVEGWETRLGICLECRKANEEGEDDA